jgi:hypothetical protein
MSEDQHQRVEQMASAIEDLLQMGVIRIEDKKDGQAVLSPEFGRVVSNVLSDMKIGPSSTTDQVMKMMYYSLFIFMSEQLRVPRSFMMALGNDMEKNRDNMESGELVTTYVSVLSELWTRGKTASKKQE